MKRLKEFDFFDPSKKSNHWSTYQGRIFIKDFRGFAEAFSNLKDLRGEPQEDLLQPGEDPWEYIENQGSTLPLPSTLEGNELAPIRDLEDLENKVHGEWMTPLHTFVETFKDSLDWENTYLIGEGTTAPDTEDLYIHRPKEDSIKSIKERDELLEIVRVLYLWMPEEEAARYLNSKIDAIRIIANMKLKGE